jgi:acetyl esterase/lipase
MFLVLTSSNLVHYLGGLAPALLLHAELERLIQEQQNLSRSAVAA